MTFTNIISLCSFCKNMEYERFLKTLKATCTAFPDGIPRDIGGVEEDLRFDHREPHPGDNGIQTVC